MENTGIVLYKRLPHSYYKEPVRVPLPIDVAAHLGEGGATDTTLFTTES